MKKSYMSLMLLSIFVLMSFVSKAGWIFNGPGNFNDNSKWSYSSGSPNMIINGVCNFNGTWPSGITSSDGILINPGATLNIASGATFTIPEFNLYNDGTINNNGTISYISTNTTTYNPNSVNYINNAIYNAGTLNNDGTISGDLNIWNIPSNYNSIVTTQTINNNGTINLIGWIANGQSTSPGTFNNNSAGIITVTVGSSTFVSAYGNITNDGGTFTNNGSITANFQNRYATLNNYSSISSIRNEASSYGIGTLNLYSGSIINSIEEKPSTGYIPILNIYAPNTIKNHTFPNGINVNINVYINSATDYGSVTSLLANSVVHKGNLNFIIDPSFVPTSNITLPIFNNAGTNFTSVKINGSAIPSTSNWSTTSTATTYSLNYIIPIPAALTTIRFDVENIDNASKLNWKLNDVSNLASVEIEKSINENLYSVIAKYVDIQSQDQYLDAMESGSIVKYRLKITDNNNKIVYSDVKTVMNIKSDEISLINNTTKDYLNLVCPRNQIVEIYSTNGNMVYKIELQEGQNSIDISSLSPALYILVSENKTFKFVKN